MNEYKVTCFETGRVLYIQARYFSDAGDRAKEQGFDTYDIVRMDGSPSKITVSELPRWGKT